MTPVSRVEMYLAKICGEDVELPIPQTRKEVFLAIIAGESYEKPVPSSRVELYLAKILGDDVPLPIPQSREEIFLAAIAGVEYPLPYPESRIEYWLHKWATYEEWSTITGNPVSFTAKAAPLRQLQVAISPVQDLHGYDSPWPAGGGSNKWDEEWEVGSIYDETGANNDNVDTLIRSKNYIPVSAETAYYAQLSNGNAHIFCYDSEKTYINYIDRVGSGTFTTLANTAYIRFRLNNAYGTTYNHDVAINYPSTVTTYSPYSNECPISGWDGVTATRTGKNIFDIESEFARLGVTYTKDAAGWYTVDNVASPNLYTNHMNLPMMITGSASFFYDPDRTTLPNPRIRAYRNGTGIEWGQTVTNKTFDSIGLDWASGGNQYKLTFRLDVEISETAPTAYVPYNPSSRSISITIGQTVYSGTVDVVTGVGEVTMASVDLGTLQWIHWKPESFYVFAAPITGKEHGSYNFMCSNYAVRTSGGYGQLENGQMVGANANEYVYVRDDRFSDTTSFKAAVSGAQIVYPLATPIPIQLTPQEVESLAGDNNLWSDANQPLTVTYRSN